MNIRETTVLLREYVTTHMRFAHAELLLNMEHGIHEFIVEHEDELMDTDDIFELLELRDMLGLLGTRQQNQNRIRDSLYNSSALSKLIRSPTNGATNVCKIKEHMC